MQIQLNTDKHINASPARSEQVRQVLQQELKHRADELTRVEVHLNDVNSGKGGEDDKRCLLEARVAGLPPVIAEHRAGTIDLALSGAAVQLARALDNALAKARDRRTDADVNRT